MKTFTLDLQLYKSANICVLLYLKNRFCMFTMDLIAILEKTVSAGSYCLKYDGFGGPGSGLCVGFKLSFTCLHRLSVYYLNQPRRLKLIKLT